MEETGRSTIRYRFVTTSRSTQNGHTRARRPAIRRLGGTTTGRRCTPIVAAAILGFGLLIGLVWSIPPSLTEPDADLQLQSVLSNPIPSFLTTAPAGSGSAADRRGLVPTDPPRALGKPVAASHNAMTSAPPGGIPIRVFFSRRPGSESAYSSVFPVSRVAPDRAVATAALARLIEGPTAAERSAGYFSELGSALTGPSSCAGQDFRIAIADGTATVRFCRAIKSGGIGQDARTRSQIEATLRQFPTIRTVKLIASSGHCLFDGSGQDRCLGTSTASAPKPGSSTAAR